MRQFDIKIKLYLLSVIIIALYYITGPFLDSNIYFNPIVTIFILILQIIDFCIIPLSYIFIKIHNNNNNYLIRLFLYFSSVLVIIFLSSVFSIILFINGKNVRFGDMHFDQNKIIIKYRPWLESKDWIEIYKNKRIK